MVKKMTAEGVTRSQLIREHLYANPEATPKQVIEALGARGIDVTAGLVSSIKYSKPAEEWKLGPKPAAGAAAGEKPAPKAARKAPARKNAAGRSGAAARSTSTPAARSTASGGAGSQGTLTSDDLLEAKRLADQLGGISQVRAALSVLEQLR